YNPPAPTCTTSAAARRLYRAAATVQPPQRPRAAPPRLLRSRASPPLRLRHAPGRGRRAASSQPSRSRSSASSATDSPPPLRQPVSATPLSPQGGDGAVTAPVPLLLTLFSLSGCPSFLASPLLCDLLICRIQRRHRTRRPAGVRRIAHKVKTGCLNGCAALGVF
ncbi:LOW QUALITY PROTEIN: hypothetical protein U9M48_029605, partial [Paspalum notatum var. saurae]